MRTDKFLMGTLTLALLLGGHAAAQSASEAGAVRPRTHTRKVFLNLTGNARLVHHFWTFLELELEDVHIVLANTEKDADAIVDGKITEETTTLNFGLGVIRTKTTVNGKTDDFESCASTSTDENGELFAGSAANVVTTLREKHPAAVTLEIDPASNISSSESFAIELPRSLKGSDFKRVERGPADVEVRIELAKEKVPVVERIVRYDVRVFSQEGSTLFSSQGTGVLSAGLDGPASHVCPQNFKDFDWLLGNDALFQTAMTIARQLHRANSQAAAIPEVIRK